MTRLNLEFLINASVENIILNIDRVFEILLQELKTYLNLDLIYSNIEITYSEGKKIPDDLKEDIFKLGVKKSQKNNSIKINIKSGFKKYVRIILLREAYNSFIPLDLQENEIVSIFIDQKIAIDLQKDEYIEEWKRIKRKQVINYDFMEAEFDRLEKFLKQESLENKPSPFQFFFSYIRRNVDLIGRAKDDLYSLEKKNFYDKIFESYTRKYAEYPDEILETIRIITEIYYKVKSYRSLLDYQKFFKEFKDSGVIQTDLSLRKFTENMQWIKSNSNIAPTYQLNWPALHISVMTCIIKFHPLIKTSKIFLLIKQLPFFTIPVYSKNSFGLEINGYFILPNTYLKDVINFIEKLELDGIIITKKLYINSSAGNTINLNCATGRSLLLNPDKKGYKKEYEIEYNIDYGHGKLKSNLSLLDWFLIDRIRYVSITGLGFERKSEILKSLKSDLINEIESQRKLINEIKRNLKKVYTIPALRRKFINLIERNQSYGFFYIKQMLKNHLDLFDLLLKFLVDNPSINNFFKFQESIVNFRITKSITDNLMLKNFKKDTLQRWLSMYFKSDQEFKDMGEEYRIFYKLFKSFYDLKLFNLKSIKTIVTDELLLQRIYQSKEERLKKSYESYKTYKITNQVLEQRLEDFISTNPPVIQPNLISTIMIIPRLTKYYPVLILKDSLQTREIIEKIKWLFPKLVIVKMKDYKKSNKYIYLRFLMPNLSVKEKFLLYSVIKNYLKDNIVISKSYLYSVLTETFSRKDFYDLEQEEFFYTKELFKHFYPYAKITLDRKKQHISESFNNNLEGLWKKKKKISSLINKVENRISKEHIDLRFDNLDTLLDYHMNLEKKLIDLEKFKLNKQKYFFRNYIKAIKIIPSFQSFGFGEYYVYFYPLDLNITDFKHFLHNSFQKIKFPLIIDNSNSFLVNFLWPFRTPNDKLLNWLVKSKKTIREYCLFFIKKIFQIFHFNYNLGVNEWDLDPNRFKIYFQNVLFNPNYNMEIPELKEFNIGELNISNYFSPNSSEFESLTKLYNWKSIDIKSFLGTHNYTIINSLIELLEKKLIFPIISLKNLDLKEKVFIILPNVKKEHNKTFLKIFSFFNVGFIYEIEGEYYIHGLSEKLKFENGLMIKLYLPDCQLDEFQMLFDTIFEYLGIEHYVILNDLVDGKDFLKSIYGSLDFLKSYNPFKNLIWNNKDKIWMNHKLFTNKFEKIFPPLNGEN